MVKGPIMDRTATIKAISKAEGAAEPGVCTKEGQSGKALSIGVETQERNPQRTMAFNRCKLQGARSKDNFLYLETCSLPLAPVFLPGKTRAYADGGALLDTADCRGRDLEDGIGCRAE